MRIAASSKPDMAHSEIPFQHTKTKYQEPDFPGYMGKATFFRLKSSLVCESPSADSFPSALLLEAR